MFDKWTKKEINIIQKYYEVKGPACCYEKLNKTHQSIWQKAQRLKLKAPQYIKYPVNQNYFDKSNYENTNILGFLCADGYFGQTGPNSWILSIDLARKDKCVLQYIKSKISPTRPINDYTKYNKETKKYYKGSRLRISGLNQNFVQRVRKLGIFPRKTGKEFIPDIPEKYLNSWLLGLFDGDGCISKNGKYGYIFGIASGSQQFLLQLKEVFFKNYHCHIYKKKESKNSWQLQITKQASIREIAQKMYENASFCLERKKQRFIEWDLLKT
jgi:DNA-binding transcriptional regulator WhiA